MRPILRLTPVLAMALTGLLVAPSSAKDNHDPCCSACANHQPATTSAALGLAKQVIAEQEHRSMLAPPQPIGHEHRIVKAETGCAPATLAQRQLIEQLRSEIVDPAMIDPFQHVRLSNRMRDPSRSAGLNIEYILSSAVAADQDFVDGLLRGAEYWEDMINSEATLVVFVGFTSNQSFLAAASTTLYGWDYPNIRDNTIAAAAPTVADYVAALPEVLSYQKTAGSGDTISNASMIINNAVYQALGFPSLIGPGDNDGFIVFNTDFDFDPDPSDGITPGFRDLVYIMVHELGHALGFTSTVDTGNGPNFFNSLDMFRLGTLGAFNEPSTLAEFSDFDRELRPGVEAAIARVGFFQNILGPLSFSTGNNNGDGRQASHWKDDALLGLPLPIGVMDPTYNGDQIPPGYVTDADRLAFSLIGWDIDAQSCRWAALNTGVNGAIRALASFDDGSGGGTAIYAAGDFSEVDAIPAPAVARWDGDQWTPLTNNLSGSFDSVHAIQPFNTDLYIAGDFSTAIVGGQPAFNIARWDGVAWNNLGSGFDGPVYALAVFNDGIGSGPALYAAGDFTAIVDQTGTPTTPASNIARWDGTQWSPLAIGTNAPIRTLEVHDDGTGPALYAAGSFTEAGGAPAASIARWNGTSWAAVGTGLADTVYALAVYNDGNGSGPALYAGGDFSLAVSPPDTLNRIARWDGAQWTPLADGLDDTVHALHVFDDGTGDALYAGGAFTTAGGVSTNRVARWDGGEWSRLWVGMTDTVLAFTTFDDGTNIGEALYAGGDFIGAGGQLANRIAQWGCTNWAATGLATPCPGDINADGVVDLDDFIILAGNFGNGPDATPQQGDLNDDGFVDLDDFIILAGNFGNDCN